MKRVSLDPKVSCPIVCGEYMRATGMFYSTGDQTFLVTARHNVLPTEVSVTRLDGRSVTMYSTDAMYPEIDIFMKRGNRFERHRYDIREAGIRHASGIDTVGIPISFRPESYGYQVWEKDDLVSRVPEAEKLDVIGFDGVSFPDPEQDYTIDHYCGNIDSPRRLNLDNPMPNLKTSQLGLELIGVDEQFGGNYPGLSGSPVLGDKLAGIHIADTNPPWIKQQYQDAKGTVYVRSGVLAKLLG